MFVISTAQASPAFTFECELSIKIRIRTSNIQQCMIIYGNISLKCTAEHLQRSTIGNLCLIIGSSVDGHISTDYKQTSKIRLLVTGNVCNTSHLRSCARGVSMHHNTWRICAFILNCSVANVQITASLHFNDAINRVISGCVSDHRSVCNIQLPFVPLNTERHTAARKRFFIQIHIECFPVEIIQVLIFNRSNLCILEHGKPAIFGF